MGRKNASHSKGDSEKKRRGYTANQVGVCSSPSAPPEKGSQTNTVERESERLERTHLFVFVCVWVHSGRKRRKNVASRERRRRPGDTPRGGFEPKDLSNITREHIRVYVCDPIVNLCTARAYKLDRRHLDVWSSVGISLSTWFPTRRLRLEESRFGAATVDHTTNQNKAGKGSYDGWWFLGLAWAFVCGRAYQGIVVSFSHQVASKVGTIIMLCVLFLFVWIHHQYHYPLFHCAAVGGTQRPVSCCYWYTCSSPGLRRVHSLWIYYK